MAFNADWSGETSAGDGGGTGFGSWIGEDAEQGGRQYSDELVRRAPPRARLIFRPAFPTCSGSPILGSSC